MKAGEVVFIPCVVKTVYTGCTGAEMLALEVSTVYGKPLNNKYTGEILLASSDIVETVRGNLEDS